MEQLKEAWFRERNESIHDFDEQKCPTEEMWFEKDTIQVRSAVYLCIPRDTDDCRIALLWRQDTTCLKDASVQFGKILYAVTVCAELRERLAGMENYKYRYLGPNCCKIGNLVSIVAVCRCYSHKPNRDQFPPPITVPLSQIRCCCCCCCFMYFHGVSIKALPML